MKEIVSDGYYPLIPDGIYEAQCFKYEKAFIMNRANKLFLKFKILDSGEHNGKVIFQAFNMPDNGRIKTGSKYYKTWCMVNCWNKPSRNAKMSPRLFLNKLYKITTRTVKPLQPNGAKMPEDFWYSVVDSIEEVIAG